MDIFHNIVNIFNSIDHFFFLGLTFGSAKLRKTRLQQTLEIENPIEKNVYLASNSSIVELVTGQQSLLFNLWKLNTSSHTYLISIQTAERVEILSTLTDLGQKSTVCNTSSKICLRAGGRQAWHAMGGYVFLKVVKPLRNKKGRKMFHLYQIPIMVSFSELPAVKFSFSEKVTKI